MVAACGAPLHEATSGVGDLTVVWVNSGVGAGGVGAGGVGAGGVGGLGGVGGGGGEVGFLRLRVSPSTVVLWFPTEGGWGRAEQHKQKSIATASILVILITRRSDPVKPQSLPQRLSASN